MMKPRYSLRSHASALLATVPVFFSAGCAFADDTSGPDVPEKPITQVVASTNIRSAENLSNNESDYDIVAPNGKFDFENCSDVKSGLISPQMVQKFKDIERMQYEMPPKVHAENFRSVNMYKLNDWGNSDDSFTRSCISRYQIAAVIAIEYAEALESDNDSFFQTHSGFKKDAVEWARIGLFAEDTTIRRFALACTETYFAFSFKLLNKPTGSSRWALIQTGNNFENQTAWDEAKRSAVVESGAWINDYTIDDRKNSVDAALIGIEKKKNNLFSLCSFYRKTAETRPANSEAEYFLLSRADIYEAAIQKQNKLNTIIKFGQVSELKPVG